jgi:hypothetical protein
VPISIIEIGVFLHRHIIIGGDEAEEHSKGCSICARFIDTYDIF